MARSLFSPSWHSVAELRPALIPQARTYRHVYRGQVWYVVQDQAGGRYHRLTPAAHDLLRRMDGRTTVQALWEAANAEAGRSDLCTQNEVVDLLVQLHAADLLQADTRPDSAALFERFREKRRATLKQYLLNPMSLKLRLVDPDAFLTRWAPWLAWCFGPVGGLLWLAVVLPALVLAGQHWPELTHNLSDQVLSSGNLLVLALVFPVVKLLHELGHAFATKVWGGAVHEMGLMFLVFAPVPYVEASASVAFPSKYRRALVAAAGMAVELFVAALALYVWLLAEPGIVRAVAFNVMLVAGVSTLVVNGNPLLRYDGYFILTDLIELPNLAQRGPKYLTWLWDRYVFGARDQSPPAETPAEKRWLVGYTPLAWCYRVFVTVSIILFIANEFFFLGVLLALWGTVTLVGTPVWKAYRHVATSPGLARQRERAVALSLGLVAAVLVLLFAVPMPLRTTAQGVVWLPEQSLLRAGGDGVFVRWLAPPGARVQGGQPLFLLEDPVLSAEVAAQRARVAEVEARHRIVAFDDPLQAALIARQLRYEQATLARQEDRLRRLVGFAASDGTLVVAQPQDLPKRFLRKGEQVGHVLERDQLIVRVVVPQDDIDLVRTRFRGAEMRLADAIPEVHEARLARPAAGAVQELPTPALGVQGGGPIPVAPDDPAGVKTLERVFFVDLALPEGMAAPAFGERVFVRFSHGSEPLAWQSLRRLRQLFLSRFGV